MPRGIREFLILLVRASVVGELDRLALNYDMSIIVAAITTNDDCVRPDLCAGSLKLWNRIANRGVGPAGFVAVR